MPKRSQYRGRRNYKGIVTILDRVISDLENIHALLERKALSFAVMGIEYPEDKEDLVQGIQSPETIDYVVDVIADDVANTDQLAAMFEEVGNRALEYAEWLRARRTIADVDIENLERRKRDLIYLEKIDEDENYKMDIGFALYQNHRKQ